MKLIVSPIWRRRALLRLYSAQTPSEKINRIAIDENLVGFSKVDTPVLSRIAEDLQRGTPLSKWQTYRMFRLEKYAGQLARIADTQKLKRSMDKFFNKLCEAKV